MIAGMVAYERRDRKQVQLRKAVTSYPVRDGTLQIPDPRRSHMCCDKHQPSDSYLAR